MVSIESHVMDSRQCQVCNITVEDEEADHNSSETHRFNFLLFEWNRYKKALVKNRHGMEIEIEISGQNGFKYAYSQEYNKGKHILKISPEDLRSHGNKISFNCIIKNARKDGSVILTGACCLHNYPLFSLQDPENNIEDGKVLELEADSEYRIIVHFKTLENELTDTYKIPVSFNFQTVGDEAFTFSIARSIVVSIEENNLSEEQVKSPFTGQDWPPAIPIFPPTGGHRYNQKYVIPGRTGKFFKYGFKELRGMEPEDYIILQQIQMQMQPGCITVENYCDFWHNVLWLEETGQMLGLQRYNMEEVNLKLIQNGALLELEVPGLAEKRPSVIVGDMIDIKVHNDLTRGYRGVIKRVNDKTVHIGHVDEELISYIGQVPNIEMDVRFVLGRLPLERQHQGVDNIYQNGMAPTLFGNHGNIHVQEKLFVERYFNPIIQKNEEQKLAVHKILNGTANSSPYIVFGPPGTGKTLTIVEAILQIKQKTNNRILVCAPANAACDMLTEKLALFCSKQELIRIMSENVDVTACHKQVLDYSNYESNGNFTKLTIGELSNYRIVVTTLILVGRYAGRYRPDILFIDEAAQACEPEANSALGLMDNGRRIVLAGDPKQLGPSLSSKVAVKFGLDISLLERLMNTEPYNNRDPNYITMLKLNFRSHTAILHIPNKLFYGGELKAMSEYAHQDPISQINIYKYMQQFINAKAGAIPVGKAIEFCSVLSKEYRQGRSPSYFNPKEVAMVLKLVKFLLSIQFQNNAYKVQQSQIGIVTPYARQVQKLKFQLREDNLAGVEVGTTETFQGREKRIIIITTVRAQMDLLLYDKKYNLGFVKHEKRFNVALTRAISKLIVVGCAQVLATDKKWLEYLELCQEYGTFGGAPFARRNKDAMKEITDRLNGVSFIDKQFQHQRNN